MQLITLLICRYRHMPYLLFVVWLLEMGIFIFAYEYPPTGGHNKGPARPDDPLTNPPLLRAPQTLQMAPKIVFG